MDEVLLPSLEALIAANLAKEARGAVKRFGVDVVVLNALDLHVTEGETIRILHGLVWPTSGLINVLGRPLSDPAVFRQTGAMGDASFYPFSSAWDNLCAVARRSGLGLRRHPARDAGKGALTGAGLGAR